MSALPATLPALAPSGIARTALEALHAEVQLAPKPGLVSPLDNGSHADMTMATFLRSILSLRGYFRDIAAAGAQGAAFGDLQALGIAAERRMLLATGGVNTHRGAIFCLGLLAAAAGWRSACGLGLDGDGLGATVAEVWGDALTRPGAAQPETLSRKLGVRGAREEAAAGFPTLFAVVLPQLRHALRLTGCPQRAMVQALFAAMSELEDTNLLRRGGPDGLAFVQAEARAFLAGGGVRAADWHPRALALHHACVGRWLSPGGSADMVAAAWFVHRLAGG